MLKMFRQLLIMPIRCGGRATLEVVLLKKSQSQYVKLLSTTRQTSGKQKISPMGWFLLMVPVTTFGLGCWQVKRKIWKENLIQNLDNTSKMTAVPLPENLDDIKDMEYQSVIVRGTFLHEKELYLGPRSLIKPEGDSHNSLFSRDGSVGFLVITPFKLDGRDETILINRGWVPKRYLHAETRAESQIAGVVELEAIVRKGETRPQFSPAYEGQIYLYKDLNKMCRETGALPIFLDAKVNSTVHGGPIGGQTRITLRNDHLSYLITWYSLSAATAYMWYRKILISKRAF